MKKKKSEKPEVSSEKEMTEEKEQNNEAAEQIEEKGPGEIIAELEDKLLRQTAEFTNFKNRTAREKEELASFVTANVVTNFLPIFDNLKLSLTAPCTDEKFKEGIDMILQGLEATFEKMGIKPTATVGESFDPNKHNAVMHIEDENQGENTIAQVLLQGYSLNDKIIRPATVAVAN